MIKWILRYIVNCSNLNVTVIKDLHVSWNVISQERVEVVIVVVVVVVVVVVAGAGAEYETEKINFKFNKWAFSFSFSSDTCTTSSFYLTLPTEFSCSFTLAGSLTHSLSCFLTMRSRSNGTHKSDINSPQVSKGSRRAWEKSLIINTTLFIISLFFF